MRKELKEFATKAGFGPQWTGESVSGFNNPLEDFADYIIQECLDSIAADKNGDVVAYCALLGAKECIKARFGLV